VKYAARLVAVLGAAAVGMLLFRSSSREVVLVYDLDGMRPASSLEVVIRKGDEVVRRATFPAPGEQVRHAVRLTDGAYRVEYRVERAAGPVQGERDITVSDAQTILLPLAR
jgi:hypothetical protein